MLRNQLTMRIKEQAHRLIRFLRELVADDPVAQDPVDVSTGCVATVDRASRPRPTVALLAASARRLVAQ